MAREIKAKASALVPTRSGESLRALDHALSQRQVPLRCTPLRTIHRTLGFAQPPTNATRP